MTPEDATTLQPLEDHCCPLSPHHEPDPCELSHGFKSTLSSLAPRDAGTSEEKTVPAGRASAGPQNLAPSFH